jgi:hypothetical protein
MDDKGIVSYIWSIKTNRFIIVGLGLIIAISTTIKFLYWDNLSLVPFVFFGLVIPLMLLWTNILPYKFYSEWTRINKTYSDKLELKKGVRVYIKNYWPWTEFAKVKNTIRVFDTPYYDFETADILESKQLLIIYGQKEQFFGIFGRKYRTRPFGIRLNGEMTESSDLYQVNLISKSELTEFREFTFTDRLIGTADPITIRIYKGVEENAR